MKPTMREKYMGTLIGCGIGDTLGMATEGWNKDQIKNHVPGGYITEPMSPIILRDDEGQEIRKDEFGKYGYYTRNINKWEVTDDTLLSLAIAESLVEKQEYDLFDATDKQIAIYNEYKDTRFGPKTSLAQAFEKIKNGTSPLDSGISPGTGNGVAMKISPVGIFMHATDSYSKGLKFTDKIARSTHKDERAIAAGLVQAYAVNALLNDYSRGNFLNSVLNISKIYEKPQDYERFKEKGTLTEKLAWVKSNRDVAPEVALDHLGNSGLAFESLPFSIFMIQKYWNSPMEGLLETVNFGGDCDTTGAMYGSLAGAKNGMIFPEEWVYQLEKSDNLINTAEEINLLREKLK